MSKTVIKVENLSKAYQIGQIGTGTISRDIERWVRMNVFRQEDPFLKIGELNDRSVKGDSDIVWSLKDLNFEIKEGDAVGIIGRNGAGKSTLLKLLSRVTSPTSGRIKIKGRVASLLEVGTGFHPELSGRENIYLNGAILGMRKKEIDRKLDEIIDFSGVERYIDTPVKRYSSGMYVRLAFAVAAHLESEILIVDEVLAVGDAEFQKKCLGKMGEVSKGEGRTVLFVSHNMGALLNVCNFGVLLSNGRINLTGEISHVLNSYVSNNQLGINFKNKNLKNKFIGVTFYNDNDKEANNFGTLDPIKIILALNLDENTSDKFEIAIQIFNELGVPIIHTITRDDNVKIEKNIKTVSITFKHLNLYPGRYYIKFQLSNQEGYKIYDFLDDQISFDVFNNTNIKRELPIHTGVVLTNPIWEVK